MQGRVQGKPGVSFYGAPQGRITQAAPKAPATLSDSSDEVSPSRNASPSSGVQCFTGGQYIDMEGSHQCPWSLGLQLPQPDFKLTQPSPKLQVSKTRHSL